MLYPQYFLDDLKNRADLVRILCFLAVAALLSFVSTLSTPAQEEQKAVLVDEFERVPCDDFKARLDHFYSELSKQPASEGYIVLLGEMGAMRTNVFYEGMIKGYFFTRKDIHPDRLVYVRSSFRPKLFIQLWIVPGPTESPSFLTENWSYEMAISERPYKFTWQDDFDDICPPVDGVSLYTDFLKANPDAHGNIVIRERTSRKIRQKENSVISLLTKKYGLPKTRLRVFRIRGNPDGIHQAVEYWLVP